jgi:hypothetical protein
VRHRAHRSTRSRGILIGALLGALALSLGLLAATAGAAITHNPEPFSPLTGVGSNLTLEEVSGIALDESTGNVFVTDGQESGAGRISILGAEGGAPVGLAAPYEIPGLPFGINQGAHAIAYDNSPTSSARGTLATRRPNATRRPACCPSRRPCPASA